MFERLAHALTMADRERAGLRPARPAGILDAQAARSGGVGRKRHGRTDTDGPLLLAMATASPADRHDSHGGVALLRASRRLWPFLAHCSADQGERVGSATVITVEIVRPDEGRKGFAVQPRRWAIERTFGSMARCRRLARDYEVPPSSSSSLPP